MASGTGDGDGLLCVRVLCGRSGGLLCTVELAAHDRVADLKRDVGLKAGTPVNDQRLTIAGRLLSDSETLGEAVASTVQEEFQSEGLEDLVLDLVDVVLLPLGRGGLADAAGTADAAARELGSSQACSHGEADAAARSRSEQPTPEPQQASPPFASLDEVSLGYWVRLLGEARQMRASCEAVGLDLQGLAGTWEALAGQRAQVCAVDPIDNTVEVRVAGVGDLWVALAALVRDPEDAKERRRQEELERSWRAEEERRRREEEEEREAARCREEEQRQREREAEEEQRQREREAEEEQRQRERGAELWAVRRLEDLQRELRDLPGGAAERRARLRALQLELHPDKQTPERRPHVQPLFLLVQREWEIAEASQKASHQPSCEEEAASPPRGEDKGGHVAPPRQWQKQGSGDWRRGADGSWSAHAESPGKPAWRGSGRQEEPAPVPMQLELRISIKGGGVATLLAERSWIVYDVKEALEAKIQLPPNAQRLFRAEEELDDADMLGDFPPSGVVQLTMVQGPPGPGNAFAEKVRRHWRMLQHAPPGPKADRAVVLAAVRQCGMALSHAAPQLRADRKLAFCAVTRSWQALEVVDRGLRADPELVLAAVRQDWHALEFAAPEVCSDRGLFMEAVRQSWEALHYASPVLRSDRGLLAVALEQSGLALGHASAELQADRGLALTAVRQDGTALQHVAPALRSDQEVALAAVRQSGAALAFASQALRSDRRFVLAAVWNNGAALRFVADELRADKEVALAACGETPGATAQAGL